MGAEARNDHPRSGSMSRLRSLHVCYASLDDPLIHAQVISYLRGLAHGGHTIHLLTFEHRRLSREERKATRRRMREIYPDVVDGLESEGGVPSRLLKTDAGDGRQEGTPWEMFAGSRQGATSRSRSRWT